MKSDDSFYRLTPDMVLDTVASAGLRPTGRCMTLNSYENRVFETELADGPPMIIKFYRPNRWTEDQIMEEHDFLLELSGNGFPACVPIRLPHGSTLGESQGLFFAVWVKSLGRQADELSEEDLRNLGRLLAELHNTAALRSVRFRPELNGKTYGLDSLDFLVRNGFIPDRLQDRYSSAVRRIAEIHTVHMSGVPVHRIHGDCHLGNLLKSGNQWKFLDFDDFLSGPAVQDLWMLAPGRDEEAARQREVLLGSYKIFRDFDDSWLSLVEPLRGLRVIRFSAWIGRRWEDPAFPRAFPEFNTLEYWENEVETLEDTVKACEIPSASDAGNPGLDREQDESRYVKKMTNRDYFWDLDK